MGALSDVTSEFKQAGPKEKVLIVVTVVGAIGVAYYLYTKKQQTGTQAGTPDSTATSGPPRSGFPETSTGTPNVPFGETPLFDPAGNLIGWQSPGTPTPTPTPTATPNGPDWFTNFVGKLTPGTTIRSGGTDVNGQRFWIGKTGNSNLFYAPIGSTIQYGGSGRVWLSPAGNQSQHVLLSKPS
jgi:hypothetical protein